MSAAIETKVRQAGPPISHRWVMQWQTPIMSAPAFWYYDSEEEARKAEAGMLSSYAPTPATEAGAERWSLSEQFPAFYQTCTCPNHDCPVHQPIAPSVITTNDSQQPAAEPRITYACPNCGQVDTHKSDCPSATPAAEHSPDGQTYWVDLPTRAGIGNPDDGFENVETFKSEAEAIAFAREHWNADNLGRICLVAPEPKDNEREELIAALRLANSELLAWSNCDSFMDVHDEGNDYSKALSAVRTVLERVGGEG